MAFDWSIVAGLAALGSTIAAFKTVELLVGQRKMELDAGRPILSFPVKEIGNAKEIGGVFSANLSFKNVGVRTAFELEINSLVFEKGDLKTIIAKCHSMVGMDILAGELNTNSTQIPEPKTPPEHNILHAYWVFYSFKYNDKLTNKTYVDNHFLSSLGIKGAVKLITINKGDRLELETECRKHFPQCFE